MTGNAIFTTVTDDADITLGTADPLTVGGTISVNTTGSGGDVDLVTTGGIDFATSNIGGDFKVTAGKISMGVVNSGGSQTYAGPVVLTRDAVLTAGSDSDGDAFLFMDTIVSDTTIVDPNGFGLTIAAAGNVQFDNDIGRDENGESRLDFFKIQIDATTEGLVRFAKLTGEQVLLAVNSISLNPAGRTPSTDPSGNRATMFRTVNGDLTLDSANGDITMGRGERLSVPGDLLINALSGTVTIADLTARTLEIGAGSVTILLRTASLVDLADPEADPVKDTGVDIVANTILISATDDTLTLDGIGVATFGVRHEPGSASDQGELTIPTILVTSQPLPEDKLRLAAINLDSTPILTSDILRDSVGYDGIARGAFQQTTFPTLPISPEPPEPPEVGPAPPKKEEILAWMQCAQLEEGDEVSEACKEVMALAGDFEEDTFRDSSALGVLQLYRALIRSSATTERIGPAFQTAIRTYREEANSDQVLDKLFRQFLTESAGHEEAGEYLQQFEFLFQQLKLLNMLPNDYAAIRDELLIEIVQELELTELATVEGLSATFIPSETLDTSAPRV